MASFAVECLTFDGTPRACLREFVSLSCWARLGLTCTHAARSLLSPASTVWRSPGASARVDLRRSRTSLTGLAQVEMAVCRIRSGSLHN